MKSLRTGIYRRWNGCCLNKPSYVSSPSSLLSLTISTSSSSQFLSSKKEDNPVIEVVPSVISDQMVVAVKHTAIMYERYCHRMSIRYDDEEVGTMGQRRWYSSNNINNSNNNNNDDKRDGSDKTRNGDKNNSISIEFIKKLFKKGIPDHKIHQYLYINLENMNGRRIANFMSAASKAKCKLPGRYISKIATAI